MSDKPNRTLSGPPPQVGPETPTPAPASSLLRSQRLLAPPPASPVREATQAAVKQTDETTATPADARESAIAAGEEASRDSTPAPLLDVSEEASTLPVGPADTPAAFKTVVTAAESAQAEERRRRRNADPRGTNPDDIIKVTFDVRRGDRDAFNAAVTAAVLFEGYANAGEFLQTLYNRETERLQNEYNGGRPFEKRTKRLPAGGSFKKQT